MGAAKEMERSMFKLQPSGTQTPLATPGTPGSPFSVPSHPVQYFDINAHSNVKPPQAEERHSPIKCLFIHARTQESLSESMLSRFDALVPRMHPNDLDFCLRVQKNALQDFKPDVVVADGFGGWVLWKLMERGLWTGPTVLVSPAIAKIEGEIHRIRPPCSPPRASPTIGHGRSPSNGSNAEPKQYRIPACVTGPVVVIHGDENALVNIEDSRKLVEATLAGSSPVEGAEGKDEAKEGLIIKLVEVPGTNKPREEEVLEWTEWAVRIAKGPIEAREAEAKASAMAD